MHGPVREILATGENSRIGAYLQHSSEISVNPLILVSVATFPATNSIMIPLNFAGGCLSWRGSVITAKYTIGSIHGQY